MFIKRINNVAGQKFFQGSKQTLLIYMWISHPYSPLTYVDIGFFKELYCSFSSSQFFDDAHITIQIFFCQQGFIVLNGCICTVSN